ncbi:hypothetical protein B4903_21420, partial [Yersinia frederiksenii]
HEDHQHIAKKVTSEISTHWIVSYDNVPEINEMYKNVNSIMYGINYSAQHRYKGSEVMYFSESLLLPNLLKYLKVSEICNQNLTFKIFYIIAMI